MSLFIQTFYCIKTKTKVNTASMCSRSHGMNTENPSSDAHYDECKSTFSR